MFTASTSILVLSRGLSPLWAALIVTVLGILGGRGVVKLVRDRSMRLPIAVIVAAVLIAVAWIATAHANDLVATGYKVPAGEGAGSLFINVVGQTSTWVQQMVGVFGWLDTSAPLVTFLIWYGALGFVVLCALGASRARGVICLVLVISLVVVVPVVIVYHEAHRLGIDWQGRYTLPLAVGIPILGSALIDGTNTLESMRPRISAIACIAVGVAQFGAFFTAERRYFGGIPGPLLPPKGAWRAPLGNGFMTLWAFIATALLVGLVAIVASKRSDLDMDLNRRSRPSPIDSATSAWGRVATPASMRSTTELRRLPESNTF